MDAVWKGKEVTKRDRWLEGQQMDTHWPHVISAEANPVVHRAVFGQYPTRSSMSDGIWIDLSEDTVRHSMTEEAADIDFVQAHFLSNLSVSRSLLDRE